MTRAIALAGFAAALFLITSGPAAEPDPDAIRKAVTFYASFDEEVRGDRGGGQLTADTRTNHPTEKGKFVVESLDGSYEKEARRLDINPPNQRRDSSGRLAVKISGAYESSERSASAEAYAIEAMPRPIRKPGACKSGARLPCIRQEI